MTDARAADYRGNEGEGFAVRDEELIVEFALTRVMRVVLALRDAPL